MKRYLILIILFFLLLPFFVFSGKQIDLKTETVFAESDTDENTILPWVLDLAVDRKGNIYISDARDWIVKKFSPDGKYILTIGRKGQGPGEFMGPPRIQIIDDQILATEYTKRQFFDLDGKIIKSEKIEVLNGAVRLVYFNHGKSIIAFVTDLTNSKYNFATGEFNQKNPAIISSSDAGRNVRMEKNYAYMAIYVFYYFDNFQNDTVVYTKSGDNRDIFIYNNVKTQTLYKIKGKPVEATDKEKEDNRIEREKFKDNFDIPEYKYHSITHDLKCYKDRIYVWIETQERYGWLCLDGKGNELAFYGIDQKNFQNTVKTCIVNDYIYYLIRDPENGAIVKRTKLPS